MSTDKTAIQSVVDDLGITINAVFVPYSQSKDAVANPKLNDLKLNWRVFLKVKGRTVIETDYSAGIGHAPSYRQSPTVDDAQAIRRECEEGKRVKPSGYKANEPIVPDSLDVLSCLVSESDAIDSPTFEDWAGNFGYDTDSRKAESTYRACLKTGLKLRAAIGDAGLTKLRDAFQDY
jgi:hypothetical protein